MERPVRRLTNAVDTAHRGKFINPTKVSCVHFRLHTGTLRLRWSRGSVLAFSAQVCGFKPGRSRRIFRAKKK